MGSASSVLRELLEELLNDENDIAEIARFFDISGQISGSGVKPKTDALGKPIGSKDPMGSTRSASGEASAREIELAEDLLEFYYQRSSMTLSEASGCLPICAISRSRYPSSLVTAA